MKVFFKNYKSDTRGNVSAMFGISLLAITAAVGAAIDYSLITSKDQRLQSAMDAATLYSAVNQNSENFESDAQAILSNQISDLNLNDVSVSFVKQGDTVVGSLNAKSDLVFSGVLGRDDADFSVRSVITAIETKAEADVGEASGPCIILLKENNTTLTLNSNGKVDATNCEVHVNSNSNQAIMVNSNAYVDSKRTCVDGKAHTNGNGYVTGLETGCTPSGDILDGEIPIPSDTNCDFNGFNHNGGYRKLTPGVYCGWYAFQGGGVDIEMEPGLYVLKNGGWNFNSGKVTGHGVTFYFANNSNINFNSGIDVDFIAPSSGDYKNILMTEPERQWSGHLNLNDANGYDFEGVIHLPKRRLTLNSGANVDSDDLMIIADELMVNNVTLKTRFYGESGEATTSSADGETKYEVYISE